MNPGQFEKRRKHEKGVTNEISRGRIHAGNLGRNGVQEKEG